MIDDCTRRLRTYRAALDAGGDSAAVAGWIAETEAKRAAAQARLRARTGRSRMTTEEIDNLVAALGNIVGVLRDADPADKAAVYRGLGLKMTFRLSSQTLQVEARPQQDPVGFWSVSEGGLGHYVHLLDQRERLAVVRPGGGR